MNIKMNKYVCVEVKKGVDKYPIYSLDGVDKGQIIGYTDNIYLLFPVFKNVDGKLCIKGTYRGSVPPIHQNVGREVTVDFERGRFLNGDAEILKYNMVSIVGNKIKIAP